jgi:hypothetical protein
VEAKYEEMAMCANKADYPCLPGSSGNGTSSGDGDDLGRSGAKVVMEGMLRKQGNQKLIKDWKQRYFVLTEAGSLLYYNQKGDAQPLGAIPLARATARLATRDETNKEDTLAVDTGDRVFFMQAASTDEMQRWIDSIQSLQPKKDSMAAASKMSSASRLPAVSIGGEQGRGATVMGGVVRKEGNLMKMGNNVRGKGDWKQRFFRLDGDNLSYFPSKDSDEVLGVIKMITCSASASDMRENCIQLTTPNRKYYVQAQSATEADEWMAAFSQVKRGLGPVAANAALEGGAAGDELVEKTMSGMLKKQGNNAIKVTLTFVCASSHLTSAFAPKRIGESDTA